MPTYEYECVSCHYTFEEFQNINDKPLQKCPKCHGKLRRLISGGAGFIFKGSGFYATDYKKSQLPVASEKKSKALAKKPDAPTSIDKPPVTSSKKPGDVKK
ncbi:zinc ribbon domain-containing protein [candidate division WOR-3 bacterium]|nr:zinc ribbon domain-containing protein [candidate division WOR-3 bacterium]